MDDVARPLVSELDADTLARRPSQSPEFESENRLLAHLARDLASDPDHGLQQLAAAVVELCHADAAVVSVIGEGVSGYLNAFHWEATAGGIGSLIEAEVPGGWSPTAIAVEQGGHLLLSKPERDFPELAAVDPPIAEALVVPFWVDGKPAGAVWAISQAPERGFDAATAQVLATLSHFGSLGVQTRERKRGKPFLREDGQGEQARARLAAIVESSDDAIVAKDLEGTVMSWNAGAARLFGYSADEAIGQSITLIIPADRQHEEPGILQRIRNGERVDHFETVRQRKDGELLDISLTVSPVVDGQGRVVGASKIARDITERKRAEKALIESEQHLRELSQTLDQRVQERTTELEQKTNRLRALAAELTTAEQRERRRLASLLHDELQQLVVAAEIQLGPARERVDDEIAAAAVARVGELLEQTRNTARNLTRQLRPPVLYEEGLVPALKGLAWDIQELYGLRVTLDWDGTGPTLAEDLRALLFESTRELLINTAKHAGVDEASVQVRQESTLLRVSVSDDGRGFDVAGPDDAGKHTPGFGLFSVRERLMALGGDVSIDSVPGEGTRITMDVPVAQGVGAVAETASQSTPVARAHADGGSERRVLVVDDHTVVREGIAHTLGNYEEIAIIGQAGDGAEAMEMVSRQRPDLVLMDVNMPGMNGLEATRQICLRWPETVVVGLSVQDDTPTAEMMREAGAAGFVPKSGDSDHLVATIRRLVEVKTTSSEG